MIYHTLNEDNLKKAIDNNDFETLDLYLQKYDINSTDICFYIYEQDTILSYALKSGSSIELINYLIKKGADYEIELEDAFNKYYRPLDYALSSFKDDFIKLGTYWETRIKKREKVFKKLYKLCSRNSDICDFVKFLDNAILFFNKSTKSYFISKCFKIVCEQNNIKFAQYICSNYSLKYDREIITKELILNEKEKYLELFNIILKDSDLFFLKNVIKEKIVHSRFENIINDLDFILQNVANKNFVICECLKSCLELSSKGGTNQPDKKFFEIIKFLVEKKDAKLSFLVLNPNLPKNPKYILKYILEKINDENLLFNNFIELSLDLALEEAKFDVEFLPIYYCLSKKVPPHICEIKQLELNGKTINNKGNTILFDFAGYIVAEEKRLKALEQLLCRGADINHQNFKGETALMEINNLSFVSLLLKNNANVDILDNQNETALLKAVKTKHFEKANILLKYKPNLQIKNKKGWTIFDYLHIYKYFYDEASNTIKNL